MAKPVKPKKRLELNPLTGEFDLTTDNNFNYQSIPTGKKLLIPENHQMINFTEFEIDGDLTLDGDLWLA